MSEVTWLAARQASAEIAGAAPASRFARRRASRRALRKGAWRQAGAPRWDARLGAKIVNSLGTSTTLNSISHWLSAQSDLVDLVSPYGLRPDSGQSVGMRNTPVPSIPTRASDMGGWKWPVSKSSLTFPRRFGDVSEYAARVEICSPTPASTAKSSGWTAPPGWCLGSLSL